MSALIRGDDFGPQVRRYLRDCAANPQLNPKYHPTEEGALKVIYHRTPREAEQILAELAQARQEMTP